MLRKLIPVLAAILLFSGCQNTDSNPAAENEPAAVTAADEQTEANVLLPDGWTMDDLRNLLVINGKTLTLPTTLNKIMELDDNFSYKAEYADEKSPLYNGKQKGFYVDVLYDNKFMFLTTFPSDENNVNKILDENIYNASFRKNNCKETDININTSCELDFDSSCEDIINIFGEPNKYDFQQSHRSYEFYDDIFTCDLTFKLNAEDRIIRVDIIFKLNDKIDESQHE